MGLSKPSVTIRRVFGAILLLPVVFAVWYDQRTGGLMVMFLALFMTLEAKRLMNMPPITGYLVVGLIMAQSIPHWVLDRPVALIYGFALLVASMVLLHTKKLLWLCLPVCYRFALAMLVYCYFSPPAISCLLRWLPLLPHAIALPILSGGGLEGQNYGRR